VDKRGPESSLIDLISHSADAPDFEDKLSPNLQLPCRQRFGEIHAAELCTISEILGAQRAGQSNLASLAAVREILTAIPKESLHRVYDHCMKRAERISQGNGQYYHYSSFQQFL
jgi:hypothetical protein